MDEPVEKQLNKRILKCGVSGTGSKGQLLKAKRVVQSANKKPDKIIVGYYVGNDLIDDYLFPKRTVINGYMVDQRLLDASGKIIYKNKETLIKQYEGRQTRQIKAQQHINKSKVRKVKAWLGDNSIIYKLLKENTTLRKIAGSLQESELKQDNITVDKKALPDNLVVSFKSLVMKEPDTRWLKDAWQSHLNNLADIKNQQAYSPNKRLIKHFKANDIKYIDLLDNFVKSDLKEKMYYKYDKHWNQEGNKFAADVIYQTMRQGTE